MFDPITTYRLQFHAGFTFHDLEKIVPYLHKLGVNTIYASPLFKAIQGSTHGYDVLDPLQINPEIGTVEQFRTILEKLQQFDIGWIQDIVPNHMAYHTENLWLSDVFEKGERSLFASFFDIDWHHPACPGKLMVPFFGSSQEDLINNGDISVVYQNGKLSFKSGNGAYPLQLNSYPKLLGDNTPLPLTGLLNEIPLIDKIEETKSFSEAWNDWLKSFSSLTQETYMIEWLEACLKRANEDKNLLGKIADEQHYYFCNYEESNKVLNYRRFFTVNALISLNMQHEQVFQLHHRLVKELVQDGLIQGLRVDHIDGLYEPAIYLQRLREIAGKDTYIVVEKILEPEEKLALSWPIQGTTGYEFLAMMNNVLSQKKNEEVFSKFYEGFTMEHLKVPQQVSNKKKDILYNYMSGDLDNLERLFVDSNLVATEEIQRITPGRLKKALGAFLIYCPVYRYYSDSLPLSQKEAEDVQRIFDAIKESEPELAAAVGLLEFAWLQNKYEGNGVLKNKASHFYKRCMQFSGPLMAKGVEDTLMYSFNRSIVHNEVGDAPDAFGLPVERFHKKMKERLQYWPISLNASSTHDTKRGEDVRGRLNAITDLPASWIRNVTYWMDCNKDLKTNDAPDANDEYFIYQTLIGTYPMPGDPGADYAERLQEYLQKALREAKTHSGWAQPNEGYEVATRNFAINLLRKEMPFWQSFTSLHSVVADQGITNSLAQVVLKFTCPGVPDIYQGCELWDFSFVDPDNRRPVDFNNHQKKFESFPLHQKGPSFVNELWKTRFDGRIKLWLVSTLLHLRKQHAGLFSDGSYIPLSLSGLYKENIVAFARRLADTWLIVAVPIHAAALCEQQNKDIIDIDWGDTQIMLPEQLNGTCNDLVAVFKHNKFHTLLVNDLFQSLPFAILKIDVDNEARGAGILLHFTSLPSRFGIGDMGTAAYSFADFLHRSGQRYWQVLPVNPVDGGQSYSPYSAASTHAGNTLMISPELLVKDGLLEENDLQEFQVPSTGQVDYMLAEKIKEALLTRAWVVFSKEPLHKLRADYKSFVARENNWLHDYAIYNVLKQENGRKPWNEWPADQRNRDTKVLESFALVEAEKINKVKWLQFIFFRQWYALKDYCNNRHVKLIGDLPFYVSYDSVDVWCHRQIFSLDTNGDKLAVAGVPPDLFSEDGQLWGMPVFKWDVLKKNNYSWWIARLKKYKEMFDLIRLDHFRAFSSFWQVPAGDTTARNGHWSAGAGEHFFYKVKRQLGNLPFFAEDLGDIDEPVYALRDEFNLSGSKVLQFAFGESFPFSEHLPHNFNKNFVAYSGTHDNNTTVGWFKTEADDATVSNLERYAGMPVNENNVHQVLCKLAYASLADTVIIPLQDLLGLDGSARMNRPSTSSGNWSWRLLPEQLNDEAVKKLKEWMYLYNR